MNLPDEVKSLSRRVGMRAGRVVAIISGISAIAAFVYILADNFFLNPGEAHSEVDHWIILITFTFLVLSAEWRNREDQRSARYQSAIPYIHKCIHMLRDLHYKAQSMEAVFKDPNAHPDTVGNCIEDSLKILAFGVECIRTSFELVTGEKVRVCIKYVYVENGRTFMPTLLRDKDSSDKYGRVDQYMAQHGFDELERNGHYSELMNKHNAVWCIRTKTNKELRTKFRCETPLAYQKAGIKDPIQSALFGAISLDPEAHPEKTYSVGEKRMPGRAPGSSTKIIGILCVDTPEKRSFKKAEEELLYVYADALFWALARFRQMMKYKRAADAKNGTSPPQA